MAGLQCERRAVDAEEPVKAAGVIARSKAGRILMCKRTNGEGWAFPGGCLKPGESIERCAMREFWEETGYRLGGVGSQLMRRVKDGVDFTAFELKGTGDVKTIRADAEAR